jgi:hypothetical protein
VDKPYYVGFKTGEQEIGLDPNGHSIGFNGLVGYYHVDDIKKSLQSLLDAALKYTSRSRTMAADWSRQLRIPMATSSALFKQLDTSSRAL